MGEQRKTSSVLQCALAFTLLMLSGCSYENYFIPRDSSTLSNRFYTFAIYNDGGRLLTHPLLDLERTLKALEVERKFLEATKPYPPRNPDPGEGHRCTKITDVYVISHGWNYSAGEAVANYHNYIELLDRLQDEKRVSNPNAPEEPFCPYLIFVSWTSTVRPVEDMTSGILPFDLGEIIRPVASITDKVLLHPFTAWKQSFRAAAIGLGTRYPDSYLYRSWYRTESKDFGDKEVKKYGTESPYFIDKDTGYNAPLSAMLYELIQWKSKPNQNGPSLKNASIHIVGHSYGAKLVALATMEALRRWVLIDHLLDKAFEGEHQEKKRDEKNLREKNLKLLGRMMEHSDLRDALESIGLQEERDGLNPEDQKRLEKRWYQLLEQTGHGPWGAASILPTELLGGPKEEVACTEIQKVTIEGDAFCRNGILMDGVEAQLPISSLVLVNPAMHPGELWYPVNMKYTAPASTLRLISRKAIIYSKYDYPNGMLFNLREALFDVQGGQKYQVLLDDFSDRTFSSVREKSAYRTILTPMYAMLTSPPAFGYSLAHGVFLYSITTAINLPNDFWYHIQHNQPHVEWMPEWLKWDAPQNRLSAGSFIGRAANVVDFFIPLVPFGPSRDEHLQGIFRLSRPALGKTGIVKLAAGRPDLPNLYGLQTFYSSQNTPDIKADELCRYLAPIPKEGQDQKEQHSGTQRHLNKIRAAIFSFDASKVYDSSMPPIGAHDDVGDRDNRASCRSDALSPSQQDHLNDRLTESMPRLEVLFEACQNDSHEDTSIRCKENLAALKSLEIVDIKGNILTIAVSLASFQDRKRTFSVAKERLKKFWKQIEMPLTTELASRLTSIPSLKLIHIIKKEKRELSFQFVYRFTRGELDSELIKTLPSEPR